MTTIEKIEKGIITLAEFTEDQQSFIRGIVKLSFNEGQEQALRIHDAMPSCKSNCGMNYCDDNGCIERKRILVEPKNLPEHDANNVLADSACLHDFVIKFGEYECQNCGQLHENLNTPQKPQLNIGAVVCSAFSDGQLEDMINYWLDHYTANGDSHYSDTPDWKIREIYWDKIVSRVIEDVNTEMTDEEIDRFCDRLADL